MNIHSSHSGSHISPSPSLSARSVSYRQSLHRASRAAIDSHRSDAACSNKDYRASCGDVAGSSCESSTRSVAYFRHQYVYMPYTSDDSEPCNDPTSLQSSTPLDFHVSETPRSPAGMLSHVLEGETPFTPRGIPPSPFVYQSNNVSPRGQHGGWPAKPHGTSPNGGTASFLDLPARYTPLEAGESTPVSALRSTVDTTTGIRAGNTEKKKHYLNSLQQQLEQTQQQTDTYYERVATVRAQCRTLADAFRVREEVQMLDEMVKEREMQMEVINSKHTTLQSRLEQLQLLLQEDPLVSAEAQTDENSQDMQSSAPTESLRNPSSQPLFSEPGRACMMGSNTEMPESVAQLASVYPRSHHRERALSQASQPSSTLSRTSCLKLNRFLGALMNEVEILAKICIQVPSPSTVSVSSRMKRDLNDGNNGFFSFFGGATEAHLSAKPLSTFLACASKADRAAWELEERVQLRARELADSGDEEDLRCRLEKNASSAPLSLNEKATKSGASAAVAAGTLTPTVSKYAVCSPEPGLCPHPARPSNQEYHGGTFLPAPLLLPTLTYAYPRLPGTVTQLDKQQIELQKEYELEVDRQRRRRKAVVRMLKETYVKHVKPSLLAELELERARQGPLAKDMEALGIAEVTLEWIDDSRAEGQEIFAGAAPGHSTQRCNKRCEVSSYNAREDAIGSLGLSSSHHCNSPSSLGRQRYLYKVVVQPASLLVSTTSTMVSPREQSVRTSGEMKPIWNKENVVVVVSGRCRAGLHRSHSGADGTASVVTSSRSKSCDARSESGKRTTDSTSTGDDVVRLMKAQPLVQSAAPISSLPQDKVRAKEASGHSIERLRQPNCNLLRTHTPPVSARSSKQARGTVASATAHGPDVDVNAQPLRIASWRTALSGDTVGGVGHRMIDSHVRGGLDGSGVAMESGGVAVSVTYHGEEGRRRQMAQRRNEAHEREFFRLREELARVDEDNFTLHRRVQEMEEEHRALLAKEERVVAEATARLESFKNFHAVLKSERQDWKVTKADLEQLVEATRNQAVLKRRHSSSNDSGKSSNTNQ